MLWAYKGTPLSPASSFTKNEYKSFVSKLAFLYTAKTKLYVSLLIIHKCNYRIFSIKEVTDTDLIVQKSHFSTKEDLLGLLCTPMIYIVAGKYRKLHEYEKMFNFLVKTTLQMLIILIIICYFHIYMITIVGTECVCFILICNFHFHSST